MLGSLVPAGGESEYKTRDIGTLQNGVYHNNWTGVEFTLQQGWSMIRQGYGASGGQTVLLKDAETDATALVWMKAQDIAAENVTSVLDRAPEAKLMQRNNFQSYQFHPGSLQHSMIGGQQALSALADYTIDGQQKVEYLTWIYSPKSHVTFSARVPATQLAAFQSRLDAAVQSIVVP